MYDDEFADEPLPNRPVLSPGRRRLLLGAAVVVVLALVVVAVVRAATRSTPEAGRPTVTVPPPTTSTSTPAVSRSPDTSPPPGLTKPPAVLDVMHRLGRAEIAAAHTECPRLAPTCMTTGETPARVFAALRAGFPRAAHLVSVSDIAYLDTSGPRLVFRRLSARAGRLRLAVEVRHSQSGDGTGSQRDVNGGENVVRYQRVTHGLTIEIQGSAPTDRYIDLGRLRRVVDDPRLLAIG